jgi:hypothetical protein
MNFDPKAEAAALLSSRAAKGRPDFADRAAACYLLLADTPPGVDVLMLWPGRIEDLSQRFTLAQNRDLAIAIVEAARALSDKTS